MLVLLLGLKHSGKSSLGRGVAEALGCPFFDLDEVAAELLKARGELLPEECTPKAVRRYYQQHGRDAFRALERSAALIVSRSVKAAGSGHAAPEDVAAAVDPAAPGQRMTAICALGGGTPDNEAAYGLLRPGSMAIYLRERPEILFERIVAGGVPPFLDAENPWESFSTLAARRDGLYLSVADVVFELEGQGIDELLPKLIQHIEVYQDGR